jgi:hypothetical protein
MRSISELSRVAETTIGTDKEVLLMSRAHATNISQGVCNMIHFISFLHYFLHNIRDPGVITMIYPFFHKQLAPFGVNPLVQ